jgi:hypothetical protein
MRSTLSLRVKVRRDRKNYITGTRSKCESFRCKVVRSLRNLINTLCCSVVLSRRWTAKHGADFLKPSAGLLTEFRHCSFVSIKSTITVFLRPFPIAIRWSRDKIWATSSRRKLNCLSISTPIGRAEEVPIGINYLIRIRRPLSKK